MEQTQLYIGGFSFATTEGQLRKIFVEIGDVESLKIVRDGLNGESRCFGFVEMGTHEQAQQAIDSLHGQNVLEKNLKVEWAQLESTGRDEEGIVIW